MEVQGIENKEIRDLIAEYLEGNEQGMRELMTWFLNQVMDHEAEQQSGAGKYVRGRGRRAHRNGHRERTLNTRRFPAYAPELNPDEQIWNVLKYQELSNWCPDTIREMVSGVKGALGRLKRHPERIRKAIIHSQLPLPNIRAC